MDQSHTFSEADKKLFATVRLANENISHLSDAALARIRFEQSVRWQALLSKIPNMTP